MKFKLKVPKKPAAESVSIGNYYAELKPGATIATESREFADYLIGFGCEEVTKETAAEPEKAPANGDGGVN